MPLSFYLIEWFKVLLLSIVEGITEWLPVSSTGHLILVDEFVQLQVSPAFKSLFLVVIQLGAILAVVLIYWERLWPFGRPSRTGTGTILRQGAWDLWTKIILASLPAGIIGIALAKKFDEWFYNPWTVAAMLILFGLGFIWVERPQRKTLVKMNSIEQLRYSTVFWIGCWQLLAAALPGTSRSGATILGALLLGVSRSCAAEFTFYLAVPAMAGASLLKLLKFGLHFSSWELILLLSGFLLSFLISLPVIRFFLRYIRSHSFRIFGWYRIALGVVVLLYFSFWG